MNLLNVGNGIGGGLVDVTSTITKTITDTKNMTLSGFDSTKTYIIDWYFIVNHNQPIIWVVDGKHMNCSVISAGSVGAIYDTISCSDMHIIQNKSSIDIRTISLFSALGGFRYTIYEVK